MGLTESLPPRGRGTALAVEGAMRDFRLDKSYCIARSPSSATGASSSRREPWDTRNLRGMGFALCLCNTKAKLAIKQEVTNETCFTRRAVD
jgi:hypothetical protein